MAERPSRPDLSATAILDSNALFTENDVEVVNHEFAQQLAEFRKFDVEFVVPQIVLREVLFRKLMFLRRLENELRHGLTTAGRLTEKDLHPGPSLFVLSLRLLRRWKRWSSANAISVADIPFEAINWRKLCSASVHRRPPFSAFDPKARSEKGFRDALVLETLKHQLRNSGSKKIVFICNDTLLREAAEKHTAKHNLQIYKTTAEYLSHLQLESKNFLTSLVGYVIEEGQKAFYSQEDATCIYTRFNIPNKILTEFPEQLAKKPMPGPLDFLPLGTLKTYSDATNDAFQLGSTTIRTYLAETCILLFTSLVRVGRVIRSSALGESEQLRIAEFKVDWRASWDAETYEVKPLDVEKLSASDVTFEPATDELLASFNLPRLLDRIMASLPKPVLTKSE